MQRVFAPNGLLEPLPAEVVSSGDEFVEALADELLPRCPEPECTQQDWNFVKHPVHGHLVCDNCYYRLRLYELEQDASQPAAAEVDSPAVRSWAPVERGTSTGARVSIYQRRDFAASITKGELSMDTVCQAAHVRPRTVYSWLKAYREGKYDCEVMSMVVSGERYLQSRGKQTTRLRKVALGCGKKCFLPTLTAKFTEALFAAEADDRRVEWECGLDTFVQVARECYPDGLVDPEVKRYCEAFHNRAYTRIQKGKTVTVLQSRNVGPRRSLFERVLRSAEFSRQRNTAPKVRAEACDEKAPEWLSTKAYFRYLLGKCAGLDDVIDGDEVCVFYCGHIGWLNHQMIIKRRKAPAGKNRQVKANQAWRKTCSVLITRTALGRCVRTAVVGKERDFGKPGGKRFQSIANFKFGDKTLGEHLWLDSSPTGFFNSRIYAELGLQKQLFTDREERHFAMGIHCDDASTAHSGTAKVPGEGVVKLLPDAAGEADSLDAESYHRDVLKMQQLHINPGFTAYRPNDQRWTNGIFRWKYDQFLKEIAGRGDFRVDELDITPEMMLCAVVLATQWLTDHPETGVASWLSSGLLQDSDYEERGYAELVLLAKCVMNDQAVDAGTSQYDKHRHVWRREEVAFSEAVEQLTSESVEHEAVVDTALKQVFWINSVDKEVRARKRAFDGELVHQREEAMRSAKEKVSAAKVASRERLGALAAEAKAAAAERKAFKVRQMELRKAAAFMDAAIVVCKQAAELLPDTKANKKKIDKLCKCPGRAKGVHGEACNWHPLRLKALHRRRVQRFNMGQRLLAAGVSPEHRTAMLDHLFGADGSAGSSGASGSKDPAPPLPPPAAPPPKPKKKK